jgi:hypothetical protein
MLLTGQHIPSFLVNSSAVLIDEKSLIRSQDSRNFVDVIEMAHQPMSVEIMFLNTERRRQFSSIIEIFLGEHEFSSNVI